MANLTAPGVYVEEVPSGVKPIEAAGTSTAAFFGEAERGPIGQVEKIFNFTEFQTLYGDFLDGGRYLAYAVYHFFVNGGSACYIGRVAPGAGTASVTVLDRGGELDGGAAQASLTFEASSPGVWGNAIMVIVDGTASTDSANRFNVNVYQDNPEPGEDPVLLETFADLSMNPDDPSFVESIINSRSIYLRVAVNEGNTNQINGYSQSGEIEVDGNPLLAAGQRQFRININGDGFRTVVFGDPTDAADLETIATAIGAAISSMEPLRDSTPENSYDVTVAFIAADGGPNGHLRITAGGAASASSSVLILDAEDSSVNAAGALSLSPRDSTEVQGSAFTRPQDTPSTPTRDYYFLGDDTVEGAVSAVDPGTPGSTPTDQDYIDALNMLDTIRDVSLIAIPGIGSGIVISNAMNYCMNRPLSDCFFIGDVDVSDIEYQDAIDFRGDLTTPNSYGAVYFPWIYVPDTSGRSTEPIAIPPSGSVAGLYGRIDGRRGVWKTPAGTEARVPASGLVTDLTDVQQGDLNNDPLSICAIRKFPASGIVVWGGRTVSSDPEYKYIAVRRMAIFLRVSIFNGIQWAVFEPNDEPLWASLRLNIGTFMNNLFRQGAFQGASPSDAYFVKCDSETTTQGDIDVGIVNVLVGFAPLKPAEFVVVKISQLAGQAS